MKFLRTKPWPSYYAPSITANGTSAPSKWESRIIGFDIDGTIAEDWHDSFHGKFCIFLLSYFPWLFLARWFINRFHLKQRLIMLPKIPCHLVTSRCSWTSKATFKWAMEKKVPFTDINHADNLNFRGKGESNWVKRASRKADVIRTLGLDIYYEDEPKTRSLLKMMLGHKVAILEPKDAIEMKHAILIKEEK